MTTPSASTYFRTARKSARRASGSSCRSRCCCRSRRSPWSASCTSCSPPDRPPEQPQQATEGRDRQARRADRGDRQAARADPAGAGAQAGRRGPAGNRTEAVHLLDQMVRQLPDGVYLKSIRQNGAKVQIVGYAQSNARVSTLMRNIESLAVDRQARAGRDQARAAAGHGRPARDRPEGERVHAQLRGQARSTAVGRQRAARPAGRAGRQGMNLDELRHLNFREVGNWPMLPKVLILGVLFVAILAAGAASRLEGPVRDARRGAPAGSQAERRSTREEGQGGQLRRLHRAAEGDRAVVRRAAEAAAQQERDGRAADRHQPGGPRPRPRLRAVQARGAGEHDRVLRRAAGQHQGHRQLPRHGRLRERRREDAAHRDAQRRRDRPDKGAAARWRRSRRRSATSTRKRSRKQRALAKAAKKGKEASDEAHRALVIGAGRRCSPAAAAKSTRTCGVRCASPGKGAAAAASSRCRR